MATGSLSAKCGIALAATVLDAAENRGECISLSFVVSDFHLEPPKVQPSLSAARIILVVITCNV